MRNDGPWAIKSVKDLDARAMGGHRRGKLCLRGWRLLGSIPWQWGLVNTGARCPGGWAISILGRFGNGRLLICRDQSCGAGAEPTPGGTCFEWAISWRYSGRKAGHMEMKRALNRLSLSISFFCQIEIFFFFSERMYILRKLTISICLW